MVGNIQKIKIENLINSFENPRHAIGDNEIDTLRKLFDAVGTQFMLNLAEDIQKNGLLGNQQIVVVYSEDAKKYIVYEGNRRVAAIKLLRNPDNFIFLDKNTIEKVRKLAKITEVIDEMECYVTDEEDAFFIMERLHSGEDKGRGIKEWGPREKDTFQVRRKNIKKISYLIDLYVRQYCSGLDITTILPFTTIQRIFNNREVKQKIGLDIENENTFTSDKMQLVVEASRWIVKESEDVGVSVTRLFNKARTIEDKLLPWIQTYLNEKTPEIDNMESENRTKSDFYKSDNLKDSDEKEKTVEKRDKNIELKGQSNNGFGGSRNIPYFFQGINYNKLNPNDADSHGVIAVCRELQLFSDKKMVSTYPLSSAFLLRSIIEQSIKYYSKKHMIQGQNKYIWENIRSLDKLSKIIKDYNKNLPNYIPDSTMRQYFTDLFGDYESNVDPLNWVVHRPAEYQLGVNALLELPKKGLLALINFMLS